MATTTNEAAAIRTEWEARLTRYTALRTLHLADDRWGPLHIATTDLDWATRYWRKKDEADTQAQFDSCHKRHGEELERHMKEIYNPLIDAALELFRCPAPTLADVQIKHEIAMSELDLPAYEDLLDDELFGIIRADIQRLTGISTSALPEA